MERSPENVSNGCRAAASSTRPTWPRTWARASILFVALASSGCARSVEERSTTQIVVGRRVQPGSEGPGVIARSSFAEVVPRIAALRVEPAEIVLVPGQRFALDSLRVIAFDAEGRELGRLPVFDRWMEPGAAALDMGEIAARRQGESLLILTPPLWDQYGRGRSPSAQVPVHVN